MSGPAREGLAASADDAAQSVADTEKTPGGGRRGSHGMCLSARSGTYGVGTAVDVNDLTRRRRKPVRQQRHAAARGGLAGRQVPAKGRPLRPHPFELVE